MLNDLLHTVDHALGPPGRWQGKTVLLAFSGGVDSTVLLEALTVLRERHGFDLQAAHIHHGLQEIADTWPRHCEAQATQRGVRFHLKQVRVENAELLGLEAAARLARYAALGAIPADVVVLGHHLDDQAESVLLQLLRGAGPAGISGMGAESIPARHPLQTPILRPLLAVSRLRIEQWANERELNWIEDPSNQNLQMDRNFLRNKLGPVLNERFRSWREGLARSAQWAAEAQTLLLELAQQDVQKMRDHVEAHASVSVPFDPACLPGKQHAYLNLPEHRLRNVLRALLSERGAPAPPAPRLMEWIRQLHRADPDRAPMMVWQDWVLRCWGETLWLEKRVQSDLSRHHEKGQDLSKLVESTYSNNLGEGPDLTHPGEVEDVLSITWDGLHPMKVAWLGGGEVELHWEDAQSAPHSGSGILLPWRLRQDTGPLLIKTASGGSRIQPGALQPHRNLRKLFQEAGVPPWRRGRMPMLHCGRNLIAVPGLAVDPAWQAPADEGGWQLIWRDPGLACYNI
jgi:tRNA(Ile)-lysidine synthase